MESRVSPLEVDQWKGDGAMSEGDPYPYLPLDTHTHTQRRRGKIIKKRFTPSLV